MDIQWWHWLVGGVILLGLELMFPSFPMVWFGLGAFLTSFVVVILPGFHVGIQALFWVATSLSFTFLWRTYLRPKKEEKLRHRNIVRR
jgi:membrane protein implicated in regulation of membrane protease activity